MRKFKFVTTFASTIVLTLGIYFLFIQSIDESEFFVENVKGNPNQQGIDLIHANIYDQGLKDMDYDVSMNGKVITNESTLLGEMFEGYSGYSGFKNYPKEFQRLASSDLYSTGSYDGNSYAIRILEDGKWEIQFFKRGQDEVSKKILTPSNIIKPSKNDELNIFHWADDVIYVQIPSGNGQKLYKIDVQKWTIQDVVLPNTSQVYPNLIYADNDTIIYQAGEVTDHPDESKEKKYITDGEGKQVRSLQELEQVDLNSYEVVDGGSKLVAIIEEDVEKIKWVVFDVTSEKLTRHSASIPNGYESGDVDRIVSLDDKCKIYTAAQTEAGVVNIQAIDALSSDVIYEGNIKDRLKHKDTMITGLSVD